MHPLEGSAGRVAHSSAGSRPTDYASPAPASFFISVSGFTQSQAQCMKGAVWQQRRRRKGTRGLVRGSKRPRCRCRTMDQIGSVGSDR